MKTPLKEQWLPASQVAKMFGFDSSTIRRWCRYKEIDAEKRDGCWYVEPSAVDRRRIALIGQRLGVPDDRAPTLTVIGSGEQ